jgi:hypothetical protein
MSLQTGATEEKSKWKNIVLTCLNKEEKKLLLFLNAANMKIKTLKKI